MSFFQRCLVALVVIFISVVPLQAEAALVAEKMRFSNAPDKLRIVIDLNEPINFKTMSGVSNRIEVDLGIGTMGKEFKDIILSDQIVKQAKLFKVSGDKLKLDISLNMESQYKVFVLKDPNRLVVDILKDYDIKEEVNISHGLTYTLNKRMKSGRALRIHYLTIDNSKWQIKPILANDEIFKREGLKSMVARTQAKAGINASYFGSTGWVIGNLKIDGEIVGAETQVRTALLMHPNNKLEFMMTSYDSELILPGGVKVPVRGVNRERLTNDLVLYESRYAKTTRTNEHGREVTIDANGKVLNINITGNSPVQNGHIVISAHGTMADQISQLKVGDNVTLNQSMGKRADDAVTVVGAGPRLLQAGNISLDGSNRENFLSDITNGRAPRTAVGVTADGKIILMVIDGRNSLSTGVTLMELANELKNIGAVDAMNLDGGGSSEMVIGNAIKNIPSDKQERRLAVALGVFPR